ncbi:isocitrate lyase-like [Senna tora]|uniref:Isocitrate lyase-like n=1 Tax=Senna tora TaxID=362788 RepID=A0A834SM25_9FABA|nr:isocitrate lyase-like [Senna tora]
MIKSTVLSIAHHSICTLKFNFPTFHFHAGNLQYLSGRSSQRITKITDCPSSCPALSPSPSPVILSLFKRKCSLNRKSHAVGHCTAMETMDGKAIKASTHSKDFFHGLRIESTMMMAMSRSSMMEIIMHFLDLFCKLFAV